MTYSQNGKSSTPVRHHGAAVTATLDETRDLRMTSSAAATTVRVHLLPFLHHIDAADSRGGVDGESELRPSDEAPSLHWSPSPSPSESFAADGFVVIRNVLDGETVRALNERLQAVLEGTYDRGKPPDKCPRPPPATTESWDGKDPRGRRGRDDCDGASSNAAKTGAEGGVAERIENAYSDKSRSSGDGNVETATRNEESSNRSRSGKKKGAGRGGGTHNGNHHNKVRVVQVINVHKSDSLFRSLAVSPELGRVVSHLAGWSSRHHGGGGARLAQDQVWAKPPGSPPLTYHRDSPYFMFTPDDVVTVWVALDDMDEELGPLEYVRGSHRWTEGGGEGRVASDDSSSKAAKGRGSASRFFPADRGVGMLRRAAEAAGDRSIDLVSMSQLRAGDISIHHGKTWHGSGPNLSKARWRRGLGLHYVPRDVRFTEEAVHSSLWRKYVVGHDGVGDVRKIELDEEDFPVVWNT